MTTYFKTAARFVATGALIASTMTVSATSARAGFFDQLFGGGTVEPAQPSYSPAPQQPQQPMPDLNSAPLRRHAAHKKVAAAPREVTPNRQQPTDLWHDKTLRVGDAIMMKDGMHVFNGYATAVHTTSDFVPVDRARQMSSKEKVALIALDTTRNDPLKSIQSPDTIASGRSAAVTAPVSPGFKITDARGASVRYVGP